MTRQQDHPRNVSELGATPELRFLRYAWPCLGNRAGHGQKVLATHIDEITDLLGDNKQPRRSLLRFVFPDAYRGIGVASTDLGIARWSHAAVQRYFLTIHDRHLDAAVTAGIPGHIVALCRVFVGRVVGLEPLVCEPLRVGGQRVRVMNPLTMPLRHGSLVAIHGRTVVDVLRPCLVEEGFMRIEDLFLSTRAIRVFVRDVLQCGCPESVFDDVRIGRPSLFGTHSVKGGLELLVGERLLVTVVPYSALMEPAAEIRNILGSGQRVRDEQGFNRFRLVLVGAVAAGGRDLCDTITAGLPDRVHLHRVEEEALLECGSGQV